MAVSSHDRQILRQLAQRVRDISQRPEMEQRRQLWFAHNALKPKRPMVLCFPEGSWRELVIPDSMQCQDEHLRNWEYTLRRQVYWWEHLNDDNTLEPFFDIPWQVSLSDHGLEVPYTYGQNRGSYVWDPPLKDIRRQLPTLHHRKAEVDRDATQRLVALAQDILGDLLTVRIHGDYWWTCGLTWTAIRLVGLEQLMLLMCDQPESIHQLMAFLRDDQLQLISWFEQNNLLSDDNRNDYTGSGGVAYCRELQSTPGQVKLRDLWGFAESQETVGVDPQMFGEFIFPYQMPLLEKFGLNCYGCCEPVHARIEYILQIPRLRRVSVSPWADQQIMAERLAGRAVFSRKPNPALVCVEMDEDVVRQDLRNTINTAGHISLELILKDTHTTQNHPERLTRWVQLAREEVDRYMGGRTTV